MRTASVQRTPARTVSARACVLGNGRTHPAYYVVQPVLRSIRRNFSILSYVCLCDVLVLVCDSGSACCARPGATVR